MRDPELVINFYNERRKQLLDVEPNAGHIGLAELEKDFLDFATSKGMVGIKGHRSVGGFRASLYNALPKESVEALVAVMKEFEAKH